MLFVQTIYFTVQICRSTQAKALAEEMGMAAMDVFLGSPPTS